MRTLKASALYYATVFGVGFVLGTLRVLLIVPALGVRRAELLEQPLMLMASFFLARLVIGRLGPFAPARRLAIGIAALALMVGTELALILWVQGQTLAHHVAGRDPVSGVAYLLSLAAFALMPLFVGSGRGADDAFRPKPPGGGPTRSPAGARVRRGGLATALRIRAAVRRACARLAAFPRKPARCPRSSSPCPSANCSTRSRSCRSSPNA